MSKRLTATEINKIMIDMLTDQPQRVQGLEADEFRVAFAKDIAFAKEKGWILDIPAEIME